MLKIKSKAIKFKTSAELLFSNFNFYAHVAPRKGGSLYILLKKKEDTYFRDIKK